MRLADQPVRPRGRRGVRSWSVAVVAAGAVLVPAAPALADHMPGMTNGTMCPHASGEGPDSLAAAGPGDSGGSARAPSETPISAPGATTTAPAPAAKPVANTTRPASQVTQPAKTQVQVQQPATTVARSAPAQAVAPAAEPVAARTPVRTTVATSVAAGEPTARRPTRRAHRAVRPAFEVRVNGLEPRVARGSALPEPIVQAPQPATPGAPAPSAPLLLLFGLATVAAIGAAITLGRRGGGDDEVTTTAPDPPPVAPTYAELSLEAELHEMVAEANARALLGDHPGEREPTASP